MALFYIWSTSDNVLSTLFSSLLFRVDITFKINMLLYVWEPMSDSFPSRLLNKSTEYLRLTPSLEPLVNCTIYNKDIEVTAWRSRFRGRDMVSQRRRQHPQTNADNRMRSFPLYNLFVCLELKWGQCECDRFTLLPAGPPVQAHKHLFQIRRGRSREILAPQRHF